MVIQTPPPAPTVNPPPQGAVTQQELVATRPAYATRYVGYESMITRTPTGYDTRAADAAIAAQQRQIEIAGLSGYGQARYQFQQAGEAQRTYEAQIQAARGNIPLQQSLLPGYQAATAREWQLGIQLERGWVTGAIPPTGPVPPGVTGIQPTVPWTFRGASAGEMPIGTRIEPLGPPPAPLPTGGEVTSVGPAITPPSETVEITYTKEPAKSFSEYLTRQATQQNLPSVEEMGIWALPAEWAAAARKSIEGSAQWMEAQPSSYGVVGAQLLRGAGGAVLMVPEAITGAAVVAKSGGAGVAALGIMGGAVAWGTIEAVTQRPVQTGLQMAGGALVFGAVGKGVGAVGESISSRLSPFSTTEVGSVPRIPSYSEQVLYAEMGKEPPLTKLMIYRETPSPLSQTIESIRSGASSIVEGGIRRITPVGVRPGAVPSFTISPEEMDPFTKVEVDLRAKTGLLSRESARLQSETGEIIPTTEERHFGWVELDIPEDLSPADTFKTIHWHTHPGDVFAQINVVRLRGEPAAGSAGNVDPGEPYYHSPSYEDIAAYADRGYKEARIVTPTKTLILEPGSGGPGGDWSKWEWISREPATVTTTPGRIAEVGNIRFDLLDIQYGTPKHIEVQPRLTMQQEEANIIASREQFMTSEAGQWPQRQQIPYTPEEQAAITKAVLKTQEQLAAASPVRGIGGMRTVDWGTALTPATMGPWPGRAVPPGTTAGAQLVYEIPLLAGERTVQEPLLAPQSPAATETMKLGFLPLATNGAILRTAPGERVAQLSMPFQETMADLSRSMGQFEQVRPNIQSLLLSDIRSISDITVQAPAQEQTPFQGITPVQLPVVTTLPFQTNVPIQISVPIPVQIPRPITEPLGTTFPGFGWPGSGGGGGFGIPSPLKSAKVWSRLGLDIATFGGGHVPEMARIPSLPKFKAPKPKRRKRKK